MNNVINPRFGWRGVHADVKDDDTAADYCHSHHG